MRLRTVLLSLVLASAGPAAADQPGAAGTSGSSERLSTPRIAVSAIMTDTGQALVWDANRGEYVVVKVGSEIQGFRVRAIFPEQVVVEGRQVGESFIFALAPRDQINRDLGNHRRTPPAPYSGDPHGPIDPYGPAKIVRPKGPLSTALAPAKSRAGSGPLDPYSSPGKNSDEPGDSPLDPYRARTAGEPIPKVRAPEPATPVDPYGGSGSSEPAAPEKSGQATSPVNPYATPGGPAPEKPASTLDPYGPDSDKKPIPKVRAPEPAEPYRDPGTIEALNGSSRGARTPPDRGPRGGAQDPRGEGAARVPTTVVKPSAGATSKAGKRVKTIRVRRAELDRALSDFSRLSRQVQLEPSSSGGFRIAAIERRSTFHRMGFRRGDVILAIAGVQLRSVDDAATVYAEIASRDVFDVDLKRRGTARTLRVQLTR